MEGVRPFFFCSFGLHESSWLAHMRSICEVVVVQQEDAEAENVQPANNISPGERHGHKIFKWTSKKKLYARPIEPIFQNAYS